jgi:hypothetical protein
MPLRDHFHPPLDDRRSWSELHGMWPAVIVQHVRPRLPAGYIIGPGVTLGTQFELDVATFEDDEVLIGPTDEGNGGVATAVWAPPAPSVAVAIDLPGDTYEVRIYDLHRARQLVAVVEILSPSNKDRPATREVLVGKCAAMLRAGVSVSIVDVVTNRHANLYAELLARLGATDPALGSEPPGIYATTCRLRLSSAGHLTGLRTWYYPLAVGKPLPTLPLWLSESLVLPLDLEETYEKACADLGIA